MGAMSRVWLVVMKAEARARAGCIPQLLKQQIAQSGNIITYVAAPSLLG